MKDSITTTPLPLNPRLVHLSLTINTSALWSTDRYLWLASFHLSNSCHIIIVVPNEEEEVEDDDDGDCCWEQPVASSNSIIGFVAPSSVLESIQGSFILLIHLFQILLLAPACHLIQFFNKFSPFAEYFILSADPNIYPPARSRAAAPLITLSSDSQSVRRPDQDSTFHGRIRYRQAETWQMDGPRMGRGRGLSLWITF